MHIETEETGGAHIGAREEIAQGLETGPRSHRMEERGGGRREGAW